MSEPKWSKTVLTELSIEKWKSFENGRLHFDPLTVLIGTNASGKSNALDALQFLYRIAAGASLTAALQGDNILSPLRGGLEWAAMRPNSQFALGVKVRGDDTTDYEYRIECETIENRCDIISEYLRRIKYRIDKKGQRKSQAGLISLFRTDACDTDSPTVTARLYNEKQGSPRPMSRTLSVLSQVFGQKLRRQEIQEGVAAVVGTLRDIFILDPIPSHMRGYTPFSDKLEPDARNIAGVIAALPESKQKEIEETLTHYVSRLPERDIHRVYAEPVGKFKTDAMLYCEEHWLDEGEPPTVDARGMSDGTLRFLAILTALLTRPAGSLLVIEEVDNGLHPSRAHLLLDVLRTVSAQRGVDVLVTTHNPALLDAMGTEMVPFITVAHRDTLTGHSVLTLLEDISQLPKLLAQGPVGRLSSRGLIEEALNQEVSEARA